VDLLKRLPPKPGIAGSIPATSNIYLPQNSLLLI
jgi:hypothetical protein